MYKKKVMLKNWNTGPLVEAIIYAYDLKALSEQMITTTVVFVVIAVVRLKKKKFHQNIIKLYKCTTVIILNQQILYTF